VVTTSAVTDHLEKRRIPFELIHHSQTYTSIDEARELGIAADEVVKTLALKTRGGDVVAVIPASRRLDMHLVGQALGDTHARLATEEELEVDFPEFELGALPPLGSLLRVRILVDAEVMRHETAVFASGTQIESVRLRTEDLFRDEPVERVSLSRHPEGEDE
jgi:Ala-tRNA(Pro) deacylase